MKKMVKLILTVAFAGLFTFKSYSQDDANKAIELYNQTVQAIEANDYATAIVKAKEAYAIAKTAEGAEETKANLEKLLPKLYLQKAKSDLSSDKFDEALEGFKQAEAEAKKFNDAETLEESSKSSIKVYLQQGNKAYENNDFAGAITAFDKALAIDSANAQVYLLKAESLRKASKNAEALTTFEKARSVADATGKDDISKNATSAIVSVYTKSASEAQKNKKWAELVSTAEKILEYKPDDATALKLSDFGNLQQGAALQQTNKAKACQFFKKVKNDAKMKETAANSMKALGCN
ncbi:MAG: hypothetical protein LBG92_06165 [Prevotellaceae bacterium]|nr:hypothetical protein [Prevotellaceae bacterium]